MRISVFGMHFCDIVLYLSRILKESGERVLILDRSENKSMRFYFPDIPGFDMSGNVIGYRGIDYCMKGILPDNVNEGGYSLVFEIDDLKELPMICAKNDYCEYRLVVGDENPEHAEEIMEYLSCLEGCCPDNTILIIRDYTGFAGEQYSRARKVISESKCFYLPYSRGDRKSELQAVYKGSTRFTAVSEAMCLMLEDIFRVLKPDISTREYRKRYKRAERGGST